MLPASLVRAGLRGCLGGWLRAPPGWAPLGPGPCPCLRWRHQAPRSEPALLLRAARRSIGAQAGGLRAEKPGGSGKQVSVQRARREEPLLSAAQRVKEAGRDFTYFIVVLVGIGVTGGLFYVIFKELFSSSSPSKIYGDALEKCRSHPEIIGVFGESIKGYGEATRRGRRQLVSHIEYVKDGLKHMRLKFYIEGSESGKQGTVHVEVKENPERGKFEVRYIFVDVDTYPRRTIVIEDNR
ncbi:mitochondrial import inner membrane translocase subunit Tim21 [Falco biarmicus]|uniref:Mitochondrial import inner membrane translocase subunit Tim21 n=1 Tax=Falco tinnunculus TaxID=100819 RepID=A0A8C4XK64_FALTI|nr:mitochondrial import inner membrane translocase subunit Tim21 [Falco cherrug]XP_037235670.1 mitochondrial import inner membrane translocase subunit Tim21 [Falco rusticolus]XP_055654816.1 mitochondrial import inner membrane translocase subunit Tim21 [Falco peregrinus]XP_056186749.1 mitochondrial import inner membrane translocase subunit Tim21 [Falco biarmicus]